MPGPAPGLDPRRGPSRLAHDGLLVGRRPAAAGAGGLRRPVAALPRLPGAARLQLRRPDRRLRRLRLRPAGRPARRRRAVRPHRPAAGPRRGAAAAGRGHGDLPVRGRGGLAAGRPHRAGVVHGRAHRLARRRTAGLPAQRPAARRTRQQRLARASASRSAHSAPGCSSRSSPTRRPGSSASSPSPWCSRRPASSCCPSPHRAPRGHWPRCGRRCTCPPRSAATSSLVLPCLVATWALGGLYLALGPSLADEVFGLRGRPRRRAC